LVRPLLETVAPLSTLRAWIATQRVSTRPDPSSYIDIDVQQPFWLQIRGEAQRWRGKLATLGPLAHKLADPTDRLLHFVAIVLMSIQGRHLTKRYLRRGAYTRFGLQATLDGIAMYGVYNLLFKTCLQSMLRSSIAHQQLPQALDEAFRALQRLT